MLDLSALPVGQQIRVQRVYAGLTAQDLAALWETSASRVSRIELGLENVRPATRLELAALRSVVEEVSRQRPAERSAGDEIREAGLDGQARLEADGQPESRRGKG